MIADRMRALRRARERRRAALGLIDYIAADIVNNCTLREPPPNYEKEDPYQPANWFDTYKAPDNAPAAAVKATIKAPLQLRARPDGRLHLSGQEHLFSVNVVDLEDPVRYFEELCSTAASR
jgi:hypothetical protein